MTKRLEIIYGELTNCKTFADIGCDHGYIVKAMLDGEKCEFAYASDISKKCLQKAESLLENYIVTGRAKCVVGDGFNSILECDQALIAGMGGEEIIKVLSSAYSESKLPTRLVLQPMKNVDKVRAYVVNNGYRIIKDYVFLDNFKFYDLIVLEKGLDSLTVEEIEFGRTNLRADNVHFKARISHEISVLEDCLANDKLSEQNRNKLIERIEGLKKYV